MARIFSSVRNFVSDESGATMVEYALIVGLIAAAAATAVTGLGTAITGKFTSITSSI